MDSLIGWQWWAMTSELVNFPRGSRFSRKRLGDVRRRDNMALVWSYKRVYDLYLSEAFLFFSNKLFSSCVIALFINQSVGQGKSTNYCHFPSGYFPCHIVIVLWSVWSPFRYEDTAKRRLERLQFSTSSSFVKIWSACSCEFKAYFWTFWALYHVHFDLETIGVN